MVTQRKTTLLPPLTDKSGIGDTQVSCLSFTTNSTRWDKISHLNNRSTSLFSLPKAQKGQKKKYIKGYHVDSNYSVSVL